MYDFEDVNRILAEMAANDSADPMVEPIDEPTCHPMDYAEVTGLADEIFEDIYPDADFEPMTMIDENGFVWYTN